MSKATPSMQARAAKIVRTYLKAEGIKGKVTSSASAGTTSIDVTLQNAAPSIVAQVTEMAKQYQYGHFDGMTDSYEYSNPIDDLPQVRFVFVKAEFDAEIEQRAVDAVVDYFNLPAMNYNEMPYSIKICGEEENTYSVVRQVLRGCLYPHVPFWEEESA